VREFATMLAKDHQNNLEQLKSAWSQSATTDNSNNPRGTTTGAANPRGTGAERTSPRGSSADTASPDYTQTSNKASQVDFVQLHQEIATQCLKDSKEMLSSKDGAEFDKCFVGMQVAKHAGAISKLTVLQRHATGKTQELISSELKSNTKHMEAAVSLMKKLADKDSSKSNR
jgi:predicted outer membrane protein